MNEVNYFMNVTGPEHWMIFDFETTDFIWNVLTWMRNYWWKCSYYITIYLVVIFTGKLYMSNRPKFDLRNLLALWSGLLAIFSIVGTIRTMPELIHILYNHGFYYSICSNSYYTHDHVCAFWSSLFALSKIVELGDTVFIVLRKQPLIFLHWYHHISVIYFTWYSYALLTGTSRWYIVMNYFVHSWMYSYYAFKAMGFKPSRFIAMMITTMQLVQMVAGCFVTSAAYYYVTNGEKECHVTTLNAICGLLMYFSYFILFAMYFYKTYLSGKSRTKVE